MISMALNPTSIPIPLFRIVVATITLFLSIKVLVCGMATRRMALSLVPVLTIIRRHLVITALNIKEW
jgi:hypothetical protein